MLSGNYHVMFFFKILILTTLHSFVADLVLKDKIFVYDLAGQRIGWANYDCEYHLHYTEGT